jgi:TRAP-type uncharacterized transport system substrate-binding protein
MQERLTALLALGLFGLLILFSLNRGGPGPGEQARVSFQIATGPSGGTLFTIGQAMAGLISHPPGVGRCDISTVCGPSGVILSARTSQGSIDSLTAVNNGLVDSALVQADMVEAAVTGKGAFRRPLRHIRAIAALFAVPSAGKAPPTRAIWVVNDRASDALVYGLVRALLNPVNHAELAASDPAAAGIDINNAAQDLPAPLHSGAARYYREMGKL